MFWQANRSVLFDLYALLLLLPDTGTIERSRDPDSKEYIGPNRVWPGGLNMCRTIGDPQAEQVG
jgi:hypothetical protein